jgi:hypothetical protein
LRAAPYQHDPQQQKQQQLLQPQPGEEQTVEEFVEQFDMALLDGAKLLEAGKIVAGHMIMEALKVC